MSERNKHIRRNSFLAIFFLIGLTLLAYRYFMPSPEQALEPETLDTLLTEIPVPYQAVASIDSFRQKPYATMQIDPRQEDIRFFNPKIGGGVHSFLSLDSLAKQEGRTLHFAMNGGMFTTSRTAQGLLVLGGELLSPLDTQTQGYGNFYMQPNGVFALDDSGLAYVIPTQVYPQLAEERNIQYATQSGPMMVIDGKINDHFNDGSPNVHIRNAVGTTPEGKVIFAISQERITFYELSSMMIEKGCNQVLYLDGFVSKMYYPELNIGSLAEGASLGPLIALFR